MFQYLLTATNTFHTELKKHKIKQKELEDKLSDERPSIELFPMTALERRAIHTLYKDDTSSKNS